MLSRFLPIALLAPIAIAQEPAAPARPAENTIKVFVDPGTHGASGNVFYTAGRAVAASGEKATYLGAATSPASPTLAEQIKLPKGVGLSVDAIDPKSPAEVAGLKPHDVLHKFDNQLLINPQQLDALVRAAKPGDSVNLSVIRQGAPVTLTAKLTLSDPAAGATFNIAAGFQDFAVGDAAVARRLAFDLNGQQMFVRQLAGDRVTTVSDDQHNVTVRHEGDKVTRVTVTDAKSGKSLFDGPAQTPEQRKAIPADLLKKIEQAEQAPQPEIQPLRILLQDAQFVPAELNGTITINGQGMLNIAPNAGARGRVLTWGNDELQFVLRAMGPAEKPTITYLLALSKKDGKTLFDGPVMTDEQRQGLPAAIAEQFQLLITQPALAKEFGTPALNKK